MAQDSEKRFHSIMDKLFHGPKSTPNSNSSPSPSDVQFSRGKKRPNPFSAKSRGDVAEALQHSSASSGSSNAPLCRPWDRGDLMRRSATFKSMTWFAKPKVVSAINCARRGWINVDMDILTCEACGARLLFSTPSSWNQQQVEKAALVFSLKLDNGHKLLCPWIDNACDETLAQFAPTPPLGLVVKFEDRCLALAQLSALPVISSLAIEYMRNAQLDQFLEKYSVLESGDGPTDNSETECLGHESDTAKLYYQALNLISLCGWQPRSLPYVVDSKEPHQSAKASNISDSSCLITNEQNTSVNLHSASSSENVEQGGGETFSGLLLSDPNSVVLDCSTCGASVGLWAFAKIPRPMEILRLVGYTNVNSEIDSGAMDNRESNSTTSNGATSERVSNLKLTIAGGPPPTRQNFRATISLPIVGRNLRTRFSYDSEFRDRMFINQEKTRSDSQDINGTTPASGGHGPINKTLVESSTRDVLQSSVQTDDPCENAGNAGLHDSETSGKDILISEENSLANFQESSCAAPCLDANANVDIGSKLEYDNDELSADDQLTLGEQAVNQEGCRLEQQEKIPVNSELVASSRENYLKQASSANAMEFDPIKQHRHFCPWIAPTGNVAPGWQQTLCALLRHKGCLPNSPKTSPSASIIKVDDPVKSVRKLFTSSAKRLKSSLASIRNDEH